jgi:hypothetical protein
MEELIFPAFDYQIKESDGKTSIFDIIRRKNVIITPEEWVRQHLVHFLVEQLEYPRALIKVEDGLRLNKMQKRSDVIVYDRNGRVFMIVECKSYKIQIKQSAMDQLSAYNQKHRAAYLVLTNGRKNVICRMDYENRKADFLSGFPKYK